MKTESSSTPDGHDVYPDPDDDSPAEKLNQAMDHERIKMRDAITNLSKIATLTVAETYEIEDIGVDFSPDRKELVKAERIRLNQTLDEVSRQWAELSNTITEVQRGVGSLQYLIDPENN